MYFVKLNFEQRRNEVEIYFSFLELYTISSQDENLNKILKSNLLLMLYNLIESSITNAVEEIHNSIHSKSISFDMLKSDLKELIIKHLAKKNAKNFVSDVNDIAKDIVKKSFNKEKLFSGNVDSKKIKELGIKYGFSSTTTFESTKNGRCLVDIKSKRNDLAHGVFSFTEIGKEYSVEDLKKMKDESCNYLKEILDNIEHYLTNEEYKIATV